MNNIIIDNIFQIRVGDIVQIYEDGEWTDLGKVLDARSAAVDMYKNNFKIGSKSCRVIRKIKNEK